MFRATIFAAALPFLGCQAKEDLGSRNDAGTSDEGGLPSRSGEPIVLASNQTMPWAIAIDDGSVYWVNAGPVGGLFTVSKSGGNVTTLSKGAYAELNSFALDTTNLYVPIGGTIIAQPIAGGASTVLAAVSASVTSVAVSGGNLYWMESGSPSAPSSSPTAKTMPVSGGTPMLIALPATFTATETNFLTLAATDAIYAAGFAGSAIVRIPLDGAPANLLPARPQGGMGFDDTTIYFGVAQAVATIPKAGGTAADIEAAQNPRGIAVDGDFIYLADDTSTGRILKFSKNGGTPVVLADNQMAPISIAVDATSVYWATANDGMIKKIGK